MKQKLVTALSFLSLTCQAMLSSGDSLHPTPIQPTPVLPWPTGTLTVLRHGYRMDADFYNMAQEILEGGWRPNPFMTLQQALALRYMAPEYRTEYLRVLWRGYAGRNHFDHWNPPLREDQTFLRNSIRRFIQTLQSHRQVLTEIHITPLQRGLDTLEVFIQVADEMNFPRPTRIFIDQRLRERQALIPDVLDAPITPWRPIRIPNITLEDSNHTPALFSDTLEHYRYLTATLAQIAPTHGNVLVIGHLDTVVNIIQSDPALIARGIDIQMGGYATWQTRQGNIGALHLEHGIFSNSSQITPKE